MLLLQKHWCPHRFGNIPELPGLVLFSVLPFCLLVEESWWFWGPWILAFFMQLRKPVSQSPRQMIWWFLLGLVVSTAFYRFVASVDLLFWGRMLLFLLLGFVAIPVTRERILAVLFITFVLVLIASTLTYQFWLAFFLFFYFWGLLDCTMGMDARSQDFGAILFPASLSLRITLITLGFSYACFVLFPRLNVSRFPGNSQISGFSDSIEFGDMTNLLQSDQVIARVFAARETRLRGAVMDVFDGHSWQNSREYYPFRGVPTAGYSIRPTTAQTGGEEVTVDVLPSRQVQIFVPLYTFHLYPAESLTADDHGSFRRRAQVYAMPYRLRALIHRGDILATDRELALSTYQQLPENLHPAVARLAREVTQGVNGSRLVSQRLEAWFQENFRYSLNSRHGSEPMLSFLTENREGHCEYFASAMVLMLRTLGYRARVVTGFLPGEFNPVGEYFTIRGRDAHAWVEVLTEDGRWLQADPTSARTEGLLQSFLRIPWILGVTHWLEFMDMRWQAWVLYFNRLDQMLLISRLYQWFQREPLAASVISLMLIALLVLLIRRIPRWFFERHKDPYLRRLDRVLEKGGLVRLPGQQPKDIASQSSSPRIQELLGQFQDCLYALRFGNGDQLAEIEKTLRRLHQELHQHSR